MKKLLMLMLIVKSLFSFSFDEIEVFPKAHIGYFFMGNYKTNTHLSFKDDFNLKQSTNGISDDNVYENYDKKYNFAGIVSDYGQVLTKIGLDIKYKHLTIYFDNKLYMNFLTKSFSPRMFEFYSGIKYNFSDKVFIDYEHACFHPVISANSSDSPSITGGYHKIGISYGY
jgi:hypothetical protein